MSTSAKRSIIRLLAPLIAVALCVPMVGVATANGGGPVGPVYPWADEWQEFTVDVGDTVLLGARWGACTRGLTWGARNALSYDYAVDGTPVGAEFAWARPVAVPRPSDWACVANRNGDDGWWMLAEYPIVFDAAGDYKITVVVSSSRPLVDGTDLDGDGRPDKYLREPVVATAVVHVVGP